MLSQALGLACAKPLGSERTRTFEELYEGGQGGAAAQGCRPGAVSSGSAWEGGLSFARQPEWSGLCPLDSGEPRRLLAGERHGQTRALALLDTAPHPVFKSRLLCEAFPK